MDKLLNHEALHMSCVMASMISEYVLEDHAIASVPERAQLAEESFNKMWDLYQLIGLDDADS